MAALLWERAVYTSARACARVWSHLKITAIVALEGINSISYYVLCTVDTVCARARVNLFDSSLFSHTMLRTFLAILLRLFLCLWIFIFCLPKYHFFFTTLFAMGWLKLITFEAFTYVCIVLRFISVYITINIMFSVSLHITYYLKAKANQLAVLLHRKSSLTSHSGLTFNSRSHIHYERMYSHKVWVYAEKPRTLSTEYRKVRRICYSNLFFQLMKSKFISGKQTRKLHVFWKDSCLNV